LVYLWLLKISKKHLILALSIFNMAFWLNLTSKENSLMCITEFVIKMTGITPGVMAPWYITPFWDVGSPQKRGSMFIGVQVEALSAVCL
jgi:hypothetical protein